LQQGRIVATAAGLLVKRKGIIRVARKPQSLLDEAEAAAILHPMILEELRHQLSAQSFSQELGVITRY